MVAAGFMGFLVMDQQHWWRLKPDYVFGWLVPVFVGYIVFSRWAKLRLTLSGVAEDVLSLWQRRAIDGAFGLVLAAGLLLFLFGALYRAGSGPTQPGSLALALGFGGVLLGMVYFNVPVGRVGKGAPGWRALGSDTRLRVVALFFFPATIWVISAPLMSAVENAISLFLLRKVVTVVFTVFSLLGYPLVQEGNILVLPHGSVGVADACSGIRSLTACLFAGSFLAAEFFDGMWKKILLVGAALGLAFFTNLLRSLFLTGWAYAYGSEAIEGTLHDATGFAVLGLTCVGLFCLMPFFHGANWRRWLGVGTVGLIEQTQAGSRVAVCPSRLK